MCYTDNINNSVVIFGYNGRDGVVTDTNGLIYMRARYYCPDMRRFVNADIIAGEISNAITLNRYAYANGNPVSNIDPFGLSAERENTTIKYSNTKISPMVEPYRGSIIFNGNTYEIYVPKSYDEISSEEWENIVSPIYVNDLEFDWIQFLTGIDLDDVNDVLTGSNSKANPTKSDYAVAFGTSLFIGAYTSFSNSISNTYMMFYFQKNGDQKKSNNTHRIS